MNWLLIVGVLTLVFQTVYSSPGGPHWFTSTTLVEDHENPAYSNSDNNNLVGSVVNGIRLFDLTIFLYCTRLVTTMGTTKVQIQDLLTKIKLKKSFSSWLMQFVMQQRGHINFVKSEFFGIKNVE